MLSEGLQTRMNSASCRQPGSASSRVQSPRSGWSSMGTGRDRCVLCLLMWASPTDVIHEYARFAWQAHFRVRKLGVRSDWVTWEAELRASLSGHRHYSAVGKRNTYDGAMGITSERMIARCSWHGRVRAWEERGQIAIYGCMRDVRCAGRGRGWIPSRVVEAKVVWSIGGGGRRYMPGRKAR